jgi:hypothetical protein
LSTNQPRRQFATGDGQQPTGTAELRYAAGAAAGEFGAAIAKPGREHVGNYDAIKYRG